MISLLLASFTATSSIGRGLERTQDSLRERRSGLKPSTFGNVEFQTQIGEVAEARSLPLLRRLARAESGRVTLEYLSPLRLAVEVSSGP